MNPSTTRNEFFEVQSNRWLLARCSNSSVRSCKLGVRREETMVSPQGNYLLQNRVLIGRKTKSFHEEQGQKDKVSNKEIYEWEKGVLSSSTLLPELKTPSGGFFKFTTRSLPNVLRENHPDSLFLECPNHLENETLQQGDQALQQGRNEEARRYYKEAFRKTQDIVLQLVCSRGVGDSFSMEQNYCSAIWYYNYALALYEKICYIQPGRLAESEKKDLLNRLQNEERSYIKEVLRCEDPIKEDFLNIQRRREKLAQIRKKAKEALDRGVSTRDIQQGLTNGLKAFTRELIKECFAVLPEPPCDYAIMALGSMSRNEMCLYSDLEFAVLLDEKKKGDWAFFAECKDYFLKFTRLLEFKIVNLGESLREEEIVKNLPEGALNVVVSGFSLDGRGSPLDKNSLLMDVPERMAAIQRGNKADIIHVSLLEAVCYLYGSKGLVDRYEKAVVNIFSEEVLDPFGETGLFRPFREVEALTLLDRGGGFLEPGEVVLRRFAPKLGEKLTEEQIAGAKLPSLNIKEDLYRFPSEAISKLCLYYGININAKSSWERLKILKEKGNITEKCYDNFYEVMIKVMQLRLRAHDHYKREHEQVYCANDPKMMEHPEYFKLDNIGPIIEIYQALIPLYEALKSFCEKNGEKIVDVVSFDEIKAAAEGFVYEKLRDYQKAETYYREVLFIDENNLEVRIGLGHVLYAQNKYKEALESYEKARKTLVDQGKQKSRPEFIKVLKGLGLVYDALGNYSATVQCYKEALEMHEEIYKKGYYFSRAEILRCLGTIQNKLGERQNAAQSYKDALKIYEKVLFGNDLQHNLMRMDVLYNVISFTNDTEELVALYDKICFLKKACYGEKHILVAESLRELGKACSGAGEKSQRLRAVELYEEVLDIYRGWNCAKKDRDEVVDILGDIWSGLGKEKNDLIQLYRKVFRVESSFVEERIESLNKLAEIWMDFKRQKRAIKWWSYAVDICKAYYDEEKNYGGRRVLVATTLYNLGRAYNDFGRNEEAIAQWKSVSKICSKFVYNQEGFEVAEILSKLGEMWSYLGKYKKAKKACKNGLKICGEVHKKSFFMEIAKRCEQTEGLCNEILDACRVISENGVVQEAVTTLLDNNNLTQVQTELLLSNQNIGNSEIRVLARALEKNLGVQVLDLSINQIGDEGAVVLAKALEKNQSLQKLNLWENQIGDVGTQALANALEKNKALQLLSLGKNCVGDRGASALASALGKNFVLGRLNLWENRIGNNGAQALASGLQGNQVLQLLSLGNNEIGDVGIQALITALESNHKLQWLTLRGNPIGIEGTKALAAVLEKNLNLHQLLELERNKIGATTPQILARAFEENRAFRILHFRDDFIEDSKVVGIQIKTNSIREYICRSNCKKSHFT